MLFIDKIQYAKITQIQEEHDMFLNPREERS